MRRFAFGLVLLLVACGGGGSTGSAGRATPQMGSAVLNLVIPAKSTSTQSSARHVLYVDPLTQSISVVVNGSASQVDNVGSSSPNCTAISGSTGVSCSIDFSAPYGNDTFAISLYSGPNATGSVIGTASASGDVSLGAPFVINATVSTNYIAYIVENTSGIDLVTENGALQSTLAIDSSWISLDAAGNIYNVFETSSNPVTSSIMQRYPAGSTTPDATYTPSTAFAIINQVSDAGELTDEVFGGLGLVVDVWNPGASGSPSYSFDTVQNSAGYVCPSVITNSDGTVYMPQFDGTNFSWALYPAGSQTPSRTITESIVPGAEFCSNYMVVGPDGTVYVTEYTAAPGDANAGLYIYPPSGPERFVATTSDVNGAGPQAVVLDGQGNIYVANSNWQITNVSPLTFSNDTLHDIEVFSPGGTSVLRHITGNFDPQALTVAPDGTLFVGSFDDGPNAIFGTFIVPPGARTPTLLSNVPASGSIVLYDGVQTYSANYGFKRHTSSANAAVAAMRGGSAAFASFLRRTHRIP